MSRYEKNSDGQSYSYSLDDNLDEDFDDDIIDVVISDTYLGLPVTQIKRGGYHGGEYLISIWIPKYVYKIDPYAFKNCPNLISIKVDPSNHDFDSRDKCNAIIETATNRVVLEGYLTDLPKGVKSLFDNAENYLKMDSSS